MIKQKKHILIILSFLCTLTVFAEEKLAVINAPNGFATIHSGQGNEFSVTDTIYKDDFFDCEWTEKDEWIKITAIKWNDNGEQVEGYIPRSKIQLIENFDRKKQRTLIIQILKKQKKLADNFRATCRNDKDTIAYRKTVKELEQYNDIKYAPILKFLSKYFCLTSDAKVLQPFFSTMWADRGSADERPTFAMGECFVCQPDIVIKQLKKIKNAEQKEHLMNKIEWGLLNFFEVDEDEKSDSQEFNQLKIRLENERKNIRK